MLILAIESTCDETAAAVAEDARRIRSSIVASQHDLHAEYAGVVPEIASRAHAERIVPVVERAMREAGASFADIDAVAVAHRPGLIGSLLVGVSAAKAVAWAIDRPLVGVDHVHAHLTSALIRDARTHDRPHARFPALALAVSGGHTAIYRMASQTHITRIGSTIDDAVGEAFDKAATVLGLPYPGGPEIQKLASHADPSAVADRFPVANLGKDSLDWSFSGLKTAVLYRVRGVPERGAFPRDHAELPRHERAAIAHAFQHAAVAAVTRVAERAFERHPDARTLLVGGGVSANALLRERLAALADRRSVGLLLPPLELCVDNAAMIAAHAHWLLGAGVTHDLALAASPTGSSA